MIVDLTDKEIALIQRDLMEILECEHNGIPDEDSFDLLECPPHHFEEQIDPPLCQAIRRN